MAYKVGALCAVTGPASMVGNPHRKTMEMIEQWVNAAGGIDGHPLDVIAYDTQSPSPKKSGNSGNFSLTWGGRLWYTPCRHGMKRGRIMKMKVGFFYFYFHHGHL
jgi:hypothetical protein